MIKGFFDGVNSKSWQSLNPINQGSDKQVIASYLSMTKFFNIYLNKLSTNPCLSNNCRSFTPSPTPMYFTGILN
jgi:hypothetical protein